VRESKILLKNKRLVGRIIHKCSVYYISCYLITPVHCKNPK